MWPFKKNKQFTANQLQDKNYLGHLICTPYVDCYDPEFIGAGSQGEVYKIKLKNDELNRLHHNWVFKKIPKTYFFPEECKIQSRFFLTLKPILDGFYYFTYTELLPGKDLNEWGNVNFSDSMTILCQLAEQINVFHHFTLRGSGKPFVHGDIKDANIRVSINKSTHHINAQIYDFGFSSQHDTDDENKLFHFYQVPGNQLNHDYFPKEAIEEKFGYKTDVYMFGAVVAQLLKNGPAYIKPVTTPVRDFYLRMTSVDYKKRPNSEEVLKFFLTLNRFHLLCKQKSQDEALKTELAAKLHLLAAGFWNSQIGDVSHLSENSTWKSFDFGSNPKICKSICSLSAANLLQPRINTLLFEHPDVPAATINLSKHSALNQDSLEMLSDRPEVAKHVITTDKEDSLKVLTKYCGCGLPKENLEKLFTSVVTGAGIAISIEGRIAIVKNILHSESERMQLSVVSAGIDFLMAHHQAINLSYLAKFPGKLEEKRNLAKKIINYELNKCTNVTEVNTMLEQLKHVDYLYKRQGFFQFSIHNHQYHGQKVSGTWLEIVKLHEARIASLTPAYTPSRPSLAS